MCNCKLPDNLDELDLFTLPTDCSGAWELIHSGRIKGCFQIEQNLGIHWSKEIKPSSIKELGALIALIRPSCLEAITDGKNATKHYADRKNKKEEIPKNIHSSMDRALEPTYNIICIHEDTMISLANGVEKPIKQIQSSDIVNSLDYTSKKFVPKKCLGCEPTVFGNGISIRLENGFIITLTEEHEVLTYNGMKKVKDLDIENDVIAVSVNQPTTSNENLNEQWLGNDIDVAYLLGYLIGNGSIWSSATLCVGTEEKSDILDNWIKKAFPNKLGTYKYFNVRSWYLNLIVLDHQYVEGRKRKTAFHEMLERFSINRSCHDKIVPNKIMRCNQQIRLSFLAGLFDSDGHCSTTNNNSRVCHFCSCCFQVLNSVRKICDLLGVNTYFDPSFQHIHFLNNKLFEELITPYLKIRKFVGKATDGQCTGSFNKDIIRAKIKSLKISAAKFCRERGIKSIQNLLRGKFATISTAKKCGFEFGDISFMRIKKFEKVENQQFYGMSVEHYHNLIGNGIIIKNCFQEQSMQLTKDLANFDLKEADSLRAAIGKKDVEKMSEVRQLFIEKAKGFGLINEQEAVQIFDIIEKSQRFAFNASHAISYANYSYISAYIKYHFTLEFFCSWLTFAGDKPNPKLETKQLIQDAKTFDIHITTPYLSHLEPHCYISDDKTIRFGLVDLAGIGDTSFNKLKMILSEKDCVNVSFIEFLLNFPSIDQTTMRALIGAGALDYLKGKSSRQEKLYIYDKFLKLTEKEINWIKENCTVLSDGLGEIDEITKFSYILSRLKPTRKEGGGCHDKRRSEAIENIIKLLEKPPYSLKDSVEWIIEEEEKLLGIALSASRLTASELNIEPNITCREFLEGKNLSTLILAANIDSTRVIKVKKGKQAGADMAFISLSDDSGAIDGVAFPDCWKESGRLLGEGRSVVAMGNRDKQRNSFIINKVWSL